MIGADLKELRRSEARAKANILDEIQWLYRCSQMGISYRSILSENEIPSSGALMFMFQIQLSDFRISNHSLKSVFLYTKQVVFGRVTVTTVAAKTGGVACLCAGMR